MNLSFEKLQELIIEETIKLLNEQETYPLTGVEKGTPISRRKKGKLPWSAPGSFAQNDRDFALAKKFGTAGQRKARMSRAQRHLGLFKKYLYGYVRPANQKFSDLRRINQLVGYKGRLGMRSDYRRRYIKEYKSWMIDIINSFLNGAATGPKLDDNNKIQPGNNKYPRLHQAWLLYKILYTRKGSIPLLDELWREIETKDGYTREMVSRAYSTVVRQLGDLEESEQETDRELKQRKEEPKKQVLDPDTAVATTGPVVPPAPAKELTSDEVYNNAIGELSLLTGPGGGNQVRNYKEIQKLLRQVKLQIRREQAKGLSLDEQTSQSDSLDKLKALRKKLETLLSNAETIKDDEGNEIKKISADAIQSSMDGAPDVADDGPTVDPVRVVGKMPRKRRRVSSLARKARIQRKLNNRLGLTMNKIQAAVGAEETGKYDRETYREILDFQKENLPPTRKTKRGKIVNNHDGLVGPVTLAKLKSKFSDWASVGQSRDKKPSTPGISTKLDKTLKVGDKTITSKAEKSQSELDRAKDRMDQSKKLLDDYLKSMKSMQSKLTPKEGEEIRQGFKQFRAQADEDEKEYLALKKKADTERITQKRREATKRMSARTKNIEKMVTDRPTGAK